MTRIKAPPFFFNSLLPDLQIRTIPPEESWGLQNRHAYPESLLYPLGPGVGTSEMQAPDHMSWTKDIYPIEEPRKKHTLPQGKPISKREGGSKMKPNKYDDSLLNFTNQLCQSSWGWMWEANGKKVKFHFLLVMEGSEFLVLEYTWAETLEEGKGGPTYALPFKV